MNAPVQNPLYRARLAVTSRSQGGVSLFVEVAASTGQCEWLWEYRNVEKWNPLTRNELRLYYYEFQGDAWRIDPNNPPLCVVVVCPQAEATS